MLVTQPRAGRSSPWSSALFTGILSRSGWHADFVGGHLDAFFTGIGYGRRDGNIDEGRVTSASYHRRGPMSSVRLARIEKL